MKAVADACRSDKAVVILDAANERTVGGNPAIRKNKKPLKRVMSSGHIVT